MQITVKVIFRDKKALGEMGFSFSPIDAKDVTIVLNTIAGEAKVYRELDEASQAEGRAEAKSERDGSER